MRLVLLGPPGAGKGTQGQYLTTALSVPKISTGDMLRDAAEAHTTLGLEAKRYTDYGRLVPDELIVALVVRRLQEPDVSHGFLLDGFPRTVRQAEALESWLTSRGQVLDAVIELRVNDEVIVERISNRRVCPGCHESYHLINRPPQDDLICDICRKPLVQRDDDRAETVRERLRVYHEQTMPVSAFYREHGLVLDVPGDHPVGEVTRSILQVLRNRQASG